MFQQYGDEIIDGLIQYHKNIKKYLKVLNFGSKALHGAHQDVL